MRGFFRIAMLVALVVAIIPIILIWIAISSQGGDDSNEESRPAPARSQPASVTPAATDGDDAAVCGAPVQVTAQPLTDPGNPTAHANFSEFVPGRSTDTVSCTQGVAGASSLRILCTLLDGTEVDYTTGRCAEGIRGARYGSRTANPVPISVSFTPS